MTDQQNVFARVAAVVGKIFDAPVDQIGRETSAVDIDGWDSVSHTMLILALEDEFRLRLDFEQTVSQEHIGALSDHIQSILDEEAGVRSRAAERKGKPLIVLFGNCQAEVIAGHFKSGYPSLNEKYDIRYIPSYFKQGVTDNTIPSAEELASCAFLLEQRTPHVRFPEAAKTFNAQTVTFPSLDFNVLWPLHAQEPRNAPRPGLPHGPNPYGDRIVNQIVRNGLSGEQAWQAYVEQSEAALSNLPRLLEIERQRWDLQERDTQIIMSDVVFGQFRDKRIYSTYNHPNIKVVAELAARILLKAGLDDGLGADGISQTMDQLFIAPFGEELQSPIHPRVARELGLTWWAPELTYNWHGNKLTYEQFMRRQIDWL